MKKQIALILAAAMLMLACVGLVGCGGSAKYTVGICQLTRHDALDAATQGFMDALVAELGEGNVAFDLQNAAGDTNTCGTIANSFVTKNVDLIMANATSALQAVAGVTVTIPILGTSVTSYEESLGLSDFNGTVGANISGTSDLAPLDRQAQIITEQFPNAQNVAIFYCSAEPNSRYQANIVQSHLEAAGRTVRSYTFSDSNDIGSVAQTVAQWCDVVYIPTDNTAASCGETIANTMRRDGAIIPIVTGDEGTCADCGVYTLAIDYYDIGYKTGLMAARILRGEANVSDMPIEYADHAKKKYNAAICRELGITPPADYEAIE